MGELMRQVLPGALAGSPIGLWLIALVVFGVWGCGAACTLLCLRSRGGTLESALLLRDGANAASNTPTKFQRVGASEFSSVSQSET